MIANSRCIACNLSKKEEKIRKHSDEKKKKEFIQKVTGILYKYGDIESTPMLDKRIQDIYNEYYGYTVSRAEAIGSSLGFSPFPTPA